MIAMKKHAQCAAQETGEEGFLLIAMIVAIFLILLALSVAAPRMAMELKREKELETAHRANQYVRGIRMYYKKFQSYPASIETLKKSNNIRFLRQEYVDPLTGKNDWKLIRAGQNKTKVKGFFGEDLPGLTPGLGSAAGLASSGSAGSSFGSTSTLGSGSSFGSGTSSFGSSSPTSGSSTTTGTGTSTGATGSTDTGSTGSTSGGRGSDSGSGSGFGSDSTLSGTGGAFMGVAVPKSGEAIMVVNEQTTYEDWEFLYDPRIEQMYAKANLLGGGISSGNATGLGSAGSLGSGFGSAPTTTGSSPTSTPNSPTSSSPTTTPPQ